MKRSETPVARSGEGAKQTRPASVNEIVAPVGDPAERDADRAAAAVWQRGRADAGGAAWAGASARETTTALLVDDDRDVAHGQMRRSAFLAALRSEVCGAVDAALKGTGRDSQGCPWVDHWFGYYEGRSAAEVERSLRRYAPESVGAESARSCIPIVTGRVRRSAETYARTGEVGGVPDDLPANAMPGGDVLAPFGGMFFKARPGGARQADPVSVRDELGDGRSIPGHVRAPMESAFGASFAGVRLHDDETGAALSNRLNARAFTVGEHVAFGRGEFRPGTVGGDALIAHELAHVAQQGATASPHAAKSDEPLEQDADRSAATAVSSLWDPARRMAGKVRGNAMPAIRSGLTLSRCGKSPREKEIERLGDVEWAFLEKKRKDEEERLKKQAEEDAKKKGVAPPATAPKVDLADITKKAQEKDSLPSSPTTEWDDVVDKPAWRKKATDAWAKVVASLKGHELEPHLKGVTFMFVPERAFTEGFYAKFSPADTALLVGMSWVRFAEADPKNVWENIAHEVAAHRAYGRTYSEDIMKSVVDKLPADKAKGFVGDERKFFEAYSYPETEIFAALWQRRYRMPLSGGEVPSGGIHPDDNINLRLNVMKSNLAPEVWQAVLKQLKTRVDATPEILERDKKLFVERVKAVMGWDL